MTAAKPKPARYRWVVLAVGAGATAALSAVQGGLPALGPAIQGTFGLSLVEVTAVFSSFGLGTVATLLAWGVLADRVGERPVIACGLGAASLVMAAVATVDGYGALLAGVALAGALGAAGIAASGRAVFHWFPRDERGFALGLRQTAVPVGAAAASFSLPPLAAGAGLDAALYALAGALMLAAVAAALWLREGPRVESAAPPAPDAARDPRIWRLSAASSLMIIGQVGVTSLLVLYLFDERGWSAAAAAVALGTTQLGAAIARAVAGRWSDLRGERIEPFRRLATAAGLLLLAATALVAGTGRDRGSGADGRGHRRDELERAVLHGRGGDLRPASGRQGDGDPEHRHARRRSGRPGGAWRARIRGLVGDGVRGDGADAADGASAARAARRGRAPARPRARGAPAVGSRQALGLVADA